MSTNNKNYGKYDHDEENENNSGFLYIFIFSDDMAEFDGEDFESFKKWTRLNIINIKGNLDELEQ